MLHLKVATPSEKIYDQEVENVRIMTTNGEITVLAKHVPFLSTISNGYIIAKGEEKLEIKKAMVAVNADSSVNVLISKK